MENPKKLSQRGYLSPKERQKYEIAASLGLIEKVKAVGWAGLSAKDTGRIGGLLGQWQKAKTSSDGHV